MRILKILDSKDYGGVFTYEVQFITEFRKRGIIVDAVILGDGKQAQEYHHLCDSSLTIPYLDAQYDGSVYFILNSMLRSYKYGAKYASYLSQQLRDQEYDAIIYCRPAYIHLAGLLSQKINSKALWHLPNAVNRKAGKNYYNLFCKKYGISAIGNSVYTKNTLGSPCEYVVYMGYDEERVQSSSDNFRQELGIETGAPVYGVAARIHRDKAQDIVVEAFVQSDLPINGGHLLVAGGPLDSVFAEEVRKSAKDLLGKQVHFLGEVNDLPKFYSTVDVVINGRRNVEPFGISVAEALGAGKPVIAYYLGGPSEMVLHKENGWLVNTPTVEEFKVALDESLKDRSNWAEMGDKSKAWSKKYSVESNVDTLIEIVSSNKVLV